MRFVPSGLLSSTVATINTSYIGRLSGPSSFQKASSETMHTLLLRARLTPTPTMWPPVRNIPYNVTKEHLPSSDKVRLCLFYYLRTHSYSRCSQTHWMLTLISTEVWFLSYPRTHLVHPSPTPHPPIKLARPSRWEYVTYWYDTILSVLMLMSPCQTGVVQDNAPIGKKFGDVLADVNTASPYHAGDTVQSQFVAWAKLLLLQVLWSHHFLPYRANPRVRAENSSYDTTLTCSFHRITSASRRRSLPLIA